MIPIVKCYELTIPATLCPLCCSYNVSHFRQPPLHDPCVPTSSKIKFCCTKYKIGKNRVGSAFEKADRLIPKYYAHISGTSAESKDFRLIKMHRKSKKYSKNVFPFIMHRKAYLIHLIFAFSDSHPY